MDFRDARERMVEEQIAGRGVRDQRVLAAMRTVPREVFVPYDQAEAAYDDCPLPIGSGQTISQPYIVAVMIEAAELKPDERVLDVGTGSGYAAAVMSRIASEVFTIERHAPLSDEARRKFDTLGYSNIHLCTGDGTNGWLEAEPFDAIVVAASGPAAPRALKDQLAIGGRLVMPVGNETQHLLRIRRTHESRFEEEDLGLVMFVRLIGEEGWKSDSEGRG